MAVADRWHDRFMSIADEWNDAYAGAPGWDIGRPQPALVELAERGLIRGRVLDSGCGTGSNSLLAARYAAHVTGIDIAQRAIEAARKRAVGDGVTNVEFRVGDALRLGELDEQFDTVLDSGVFHVFDDDPRAAYVASLASVLRPGGRLLLLCFSEATPGEWGPRRVTADELRAAFADGWTVESLDRTSFAVTPGQPVPAADAWRAVIRRVPAPVNRQ